MQSRLGKILRAPETDVISELASARRKISTLPQAEIANVLDDTKAKIASCVLDEDHLEEVWKIAEKHLQEFPFEPREGFENLGQFEKYALQMNQLLAAEKKIFNQYQLELLRPDPENPQAKKYRILVECADGRNSIALHLPKGQLLSRFGIRWLPFAGLILFPNFPNFDSPAELKKLLVVNPQLKQEIWRRLEFVFGRDLAHGVEMLEGSQIQHLHLEYQAHFDHDCAHGGCGAHSSNLNAAQLETAKNCLLTEIWLQEKYSELMTEGKIRLYRTVHNTGNSGHIHSAKVIDQENLDCEILENKQAVWSYCAQNFEHPKPQNENLVLREYQGNPMGVELEEHAEQVIRVSNFHFAHTLVGQSTLEISWHDQAEIIYQHICNLMGIVQKNFLSKHPEKPMILHLDLEKKRPEIEAIYVQVLGKICYNPEMVKMMAQDKLQLFVTETDGMSYETTIRKSV